MNQAQLDVFDELDFEEVQRENGTGYKFNCKDCSREDMILRLMQETYGQEEDELESEEGEQSESPEEACEAMFRDLMSSLQQMQLGDGQESGLHRARIHSADDFFNVHGEAQNQ